MVLPREGGYRGAVLQSAEFRLAAKLNLEIVKRHVRTIWFVARTSDHPGQGPRVVEALRLTGGPSPASRQARDPAVTLDDMVMKSGDSVAESAGGRHKTRHVHVPSVGISS
jgi:hypothetical protein